MQMLNGILYGVGKAAHAAFFLDAATGEMTSGRARSIVWLAVALISLIFGLIGQRRPAGRISPIVALIVGTLAVIVSIIHIATSTGFGTGGGRAGAIVALILALGGLALGTSTLIRRRSAVAHVSGAS